LALFKKILVIQTAFIGDVVLATALVEKLSSHFPDATIDFLLRRGNEGLLTAHPHINKVWIWDKKVSKYLNLFRLLRQVKQERFDIVINLQRFFSMGLLTAFSGANTRVCFDKNTLSFLATHRVKHEIGKDGSTIHEVERNLVLVAQWTDNQFVGPKLYPTLTLFFTIKNTSLFHRPQFGLPNNFPGKNGFNSWKG
jgi:heptosyltransferase II